MKRLFQTMDSTGDGAINLEECLGGHGNLETVRNRCILDVSNSCVCVVAVIVCYCLFL